MSHDKQGESESPRMESPNAQVGFSSNVSFNFEITKCSKLNG